MQGSSEQYGHVSWFSIGFPFVRSEDLIVRGRSVGVGGGEGFDASKAFGLDLDLVFFSNLEVLDDFSDGNFHGGLAAVDVVEVDVSEGVGYPVGAVVLDGYFYNVT